ncbi:MULTISPECIES: integrase arm-type DNA-binding domain-containing protein [unclassified Desulfovibrio]|uniref:tyrosine-type recombinase/integrase n=1 Tax=unclassified Desulfovibrio TaxID=2593640 RepID=UPI0013EB6F41|nr:MULTISPECIES: integrase arm-type DNA-binding domain-containing protein [unclassified Desulfovibrio]
MLDDRFIQGLKAADKPKKYADGGGLFLFIPASGKKLWRLAYRFDRKAKLLSFGEYPQVSLRAARQRRDEAKEVLKDGIDPAEHRKAARASTDTATFQSVAMEWYERETLHCRSRYRAFMMRGMTEYFFPAFGGKVMTDIAAEDIMSAIEPLRQSGKLRGGRRLTDVCGQICRYAVATGKAARDATEELPMSLRSRQTGHRAAALDAGKLGQIMLNLERHDGYFPVKCALRLVPLLFVRSGELRCAAWSEFDFSRRLWIIPAQRMAAKHEHVVPLAPQVVNILRELKAYSGHGTLLFPGVRIPERPIDISTITVSLRRRGYDGIKLSFDGIRSLVAKLLPDLGYEQNIIDIQLARSGRTRFDPWQYLPERKTMMREWAGYLFLLRDKALRETSRQGGTSC